VRVPAPQAYRAQTYLVEGDCSSASYFWAAAAVTGGEVYTAPISPEALQGDCRFLSILERMGCRVSWEEDGVRVLGPPQLQAVDLDMNHMPDMVPTLAVLAAFADGKSQIRNVAHLRIKESDRLRVMAMELAKLGVKVDDHRIAMAFAVAGLRVPGIKIYGAEAVSKSFPSFWEEFEGFSYGIGSR
jgi:3-phosphoshikimate 1-carboxyvinyltransferase